MELNVKPLEVEKNKIYVLTCTEVLSVKQMRVLRDYIDKIGLQYGVSFIVLEKGLNMVQTDSLKELKEFVEFIYEKLRPQEIL